MLDRIEQKIDPLDWTKNDIVQFYLKRPKVNKNLKSKKRKTVIKEDLGERRRRARRRRRTRRRK